MAISKSVLEIKSCIKQRGCSTMWDTPNMQRFLQVTISKQIEGWMCARDLPCTLETPDSIVV